MGESFSSFSLNSIGTGYLQRAMREGAITLVNAKINIKEFGESPLQNKLNYLFI